MGLLDQAILGRTLGAEAQSALIDLSCAGFTPSSVKAGTRSITATALLANQTTDPHDVTWGVTINGTVVGGWDTVQVPAYYPLRPSKTVTVDLQSDATIGVAQRYGHQQTATCGTLHVATTTFDPSLVTVEACSFSPKTVDGTGAKLTYQGSIRNRNDVAATAQLTFNLVVSHYLPPVLARTPTITIPANDVVSVPPVTRRLDNPVADSAGAIKQVVANGGGFDVDPAVVNASRA